MLRSARTGSTHMLEPFAAEILRLLIEAREPMRVEDLQARLGLEANDGDSEQCSRAIEGVLKEFKRLGLAEPHGD